MHKKIKIGIVGVNPDRGWASITHIPALKTLPDYELTAISNRTAAIAEAAGKAFTIPLTFADNRALMESPDVDLVAITVPVPQHNELVRLAVEAGKHVYCEWPLGNGVQEAEELAALVKEKGVFGAVGLQSRAVGAINYINDLLQEGYVGEVLSTSLLGSGIIFGAYTPQAFAYAVDAKNGAGMIYATFGNAIDALCYCLGEFKELNATAITRRKTTQLIETGEHIPMTAYDQIAITGILQSGAVAAAHYRGGMFKGTNFLWEINGTEGDLVITADGGSPAVFDLTIKGSHGVGQALEILPLPEKYQLEHSGNLSTPAQNVARNYVRVAKDIHEGTHLSATFQDAVIRQRMIHAIEVSAATGTRQRYRLD